MILYKDLYLLNGRTRKWRLRLDCRIIILRSFGWVSNLFWDTVAKEKSQKQLKVTNMQVSPLQNYVAGDFFVQGGPPTSYKCGYNPI